MSHEILPFTYEGINVRTATNENGEPLIVAADVCRVLDISNNRDALARLDEDEKGVVSTDTPGGIQQVAAVTEPGFYRLVMSSRKPQAKPFQRWAAHEVFPAIRKHGGYLTPDMAEQVLTDPDTIIRLATDLKAERAARLRETKAREAIESYAQTLEPKADSYDRFLSGDGTYSIGAVGKMYGLSQQKMFDLLRNSSVLIAKGAMRNTPYQQYMHHFRVTAFSFTRSDGTEGTSYTTRVQPSGVDFIARKLSLSLKAAA